MIPDDRRYTKTHEWAKMEGDLVRVGITDHAVEELGDVTYVEVKRVGTRVAKGEPMGFVESNKAVEDIYAPVSGEIVEVNAAAGVAEEGREVESAPDPVSEDPYGSGWIAAIRPDDPSEYSGLLSPEDYRKLLEEEK